MVNYVQLGMMIAEAKEGCAKLDEMAQRYEADHFSAAFQALLGGDRYARNLSLENVKKTPEMLIDAKIELWFKIGEKYGWSREAMEQHLPEDLRYGRYRRGFIKP